MLILICYQFLDLNFLKVNTLKDRTVPQNKNEIFFTTKTYRLTLFYTTFIFCFLVFKYLFALMLVFIERRVQHTVALFKYTTMLQFRIRLESGKE